MEISIYNSKGDAIDTVKPSSSVFGVKIIPDLLHQVILAYAANKRSAIAHTKDRSDVRGGGKKPWKQKGTGRARHGSIRSPIWKGGGVAFGPRSDRNFSQKINVKMRRQALLMSISAKLADKQLVLVDTLDLSTGKTKDAFKIINSVTKNIEGYRAYKNHKDGLLIVSADDTAVVSRVVNNIPFVNNIDIKNLNAHDILSNKFIIFTKDAFNTINK